MRVLFLTHRLPYAPNRGDRIRAYHILKASSANERTSSSSRSCTTPTKRGRADDVPAARRHGHVVPWSHACAI